MLREFDLVDKAFVEDGFNLPESKSDIAWIDEDHLYVGTNFGPGSMTKSSYPRVMKEWTRGTPLASAKPIYEVKDDDISVGVQRDLTPGFERDFLLRQIDFFTSETFLRRNDGTLVKIDVPLDANVDAHREWLVVQLRTDWSVGGKTFRGGSLLAAKFDEFIAGKRDLVAVVHADGHGVARELLVDARSLAARSARQRRLARGSADAEPRRRLEASVARRCAAAFHRRRAWRRPLTRATTTS